jgi:hypothetical protein
MKYQVGDQFEHQGGVPNVWEITRALPPDTYEYCCIRTASGGRPFVGMFTVDEASLCNVYRLVGGPTFMAQQQATAPSASAPASTVTRDTKRNPQVGDLYRKDDGSEYCMIEVKPLFKLECVNPNGTTRKAGSFVTQISMDHPYWTPIPVQVQAAPSAPSQVAVGDRFESVGYGTIWEVIAPARTPGKWVIMVTRVTSMSAFSIGHTAEETEANLLNPAQYQRVSSGAAQSTSPPPTAKAPHAWAPGQFALCNVDGSVWELVAVDRVVDEYYLVLVAPGSRFQSPGQRMQIDGVQMVVEFTPTPNPAQSSAGGVSSGRFSSSAPNVAAVPKNAPGLRYEDYDAACHQYAVFAPEAEKCECGAHAVNSKMHSQWCPLNGKE